MSAMWHCIHHSHDRATRPAEPPEPEPEPEQPKVKVRKPSNSSLESLKQLEAAAAATTPKQPAKVDDDLLEGAGIGSIVDESILHIPCPNGHELETPLDMLGQRAMCPHCGAEFKLKREKSIEYLREQEILDRQRAKFWFQLSVLAAGFVVVVVLAMIIIVAVT